MQGPLAQLNALQAQPNLYFKEYMRTGGFLQFPWRWSVYAKSECLPMVHKAAQNPAQYGAELGGMGSQTGFQERDRESFEPSTVPRDTAQCEGKRKSGKDRSAGVDGNRTHQTPFQGSRRV